MGIPWDGVGWDKHELLWNGMGWDRKICPMDKPDNEARINFDVFQDIAKFWIQLPNKHSKVRNRALQVLTRFVTTYVCEAGFSLMVFIKNDYRSRITNLNLENSLVCCLTSYIPRYRKLIKQWPFPIKEIFNFPN